MTDHSILAIMAHPDDAEMWAGGTLAKHAQAGKAALLVASNDNVRIREAEEGAAILGVALHIRQELSAESCLNVIEAVQADIVICHRLDDTHPDHRRVGELVSAVMHKAVIKLQKRIRLYACDTYESLTLNGHVPGNVIVNIEETFDSKMTALGKHASQPLEHFSDMAQRQARVWGARIGVRWGEAFDTVPVLGVVPGVEHL